MDGVAIHVIIEKYGGAVHVIMLSSFVLLTLPFHW